MSVDRPTMKDVYEAVSGLEAKVEGKFKDFDEKLENVPQRREMRLTVAVGLLGGQAVASLIAAYITHLSPPQQAAALLHLLFS